MKNLLNETTRRALEYFEGLPLRKVWPDQESLDRLKVLAGPFPDHPAPAEDVLAQLDDYGSPATVATSGSRYFGFVIGGSLPASLAANWLSAAWDQNAFCQASSPAAMFFERLAGRWVLEALGLPKRSGVSFTTGATMSNFTALAAARHAVLAAAGWDADKDGLFGAPPITVILGEEAHPSVRKSLGLLGLGRERVVVVSSDGQGRIRPQAIPSVKGPTIVILQAGNVNTGSFDPFDPICDGLRDSGAWVHVDGAFGLWALAAPGFRHLTEGLEKADSWATDGHKWLNVPYDSGIAMVREPGWLHHAVSISASYLPESESCTPESSRKARGLEVWAALKNLGRSGLANLIERTCSHARRFADGLEKAGFDVLNDAVLNQVLVSFGDQEVTRKVIAEIQADGVCWCGGTVWQNQQAMRISVSSWATTKEDVDKSLDAIIRAARRHTGR